MLKTPSTRRRFLSMISMAPLAGKQAAEQVAQRLAGIEVGMTGGAASCAPPSSAGYPANTAAGVAVRRASLRSAMMLPGFRAEIESALYDQQRRVGQIDPDIAVWRSVSLAAKIAYQRQRNVARALEFDVIEELTPWQRLRELVDGVLRPKLFG